jgi:hypothetical protein
MSRRPVHRVFSAMGACKDANREALQEGRSRTAGLPEARAAPPAQPLRHAPPDPPADLPRRRHERLAREVKLQFGRAVTWKPRPW